MKFDIEVQDLKTNSYRFLYNLNVLELFYYLWRLDNNKAKRLKIVRRRKRK